MAVAAELDVVDGVGFAHAAQARGRPVRSRPHGPAAVTAICSALPGVAPLMLAAFVGRLPYGMNILALILLLRAAGFDYAEVGIITAASGLSVGVAAPVLGRVIDRVGQTKVLVTAAVFTAITGVALVVAVLEGAGATLVTVLAFVAGLSVPPVSPSLRSLLPASSAATGSTPRSRSTRSCSSSSSSRAAAGRGHRDGDLARGGVPDRRRAPGRAAGSASPPRPTRGAGGRRRTSPARAAPARSARRASACSSSRWR